MKSLSSNSYPMWNKSILIIAVCAITISCKKSKSGNQMQEAVRHDTVLTEEKLVDILTYKVKEEQHQKDSLDLTFNYIILEKTAPFEYELKIDMETEPSKIQFYKDYYVIFAIYPEDDKIGLLAPDRKRYGFESFSAKFIKNKNNELVIQRKIKTKIAFARAVTLMVMAYKNNRKSQVLVMQNVPI